MTKHVKEFIELNIDAIEQSDWVTVFKNWYIYDKDIYFDELMSVLESAYSNIWKETQEAREYVFEEIAKIVFTNLIVKQKRITLRQFGMYAKSLFGFQGNDLMRVVNNAANAVGLSKDYEGWILL